jgi:hypothetical protein
VYYRAAAPKKAHDRIEPGSQQAAIIRGTQQSAAVAQKVVLYEEDTADPNVSASSARRSGGPRRSPRDWGSRPSLRSAPTSKCRSALHRVRCPAFSSVFPKNR